jgi:hypothetical protein
MDFIESSLFRLQENVRRFVVPPAAFSDVPALKAQIKLRQMALTDIEIIRRRLRPFMREGAWRYRVSGELRRTGSRISHSRR